MLLDRLTFTHSEFGHIVENLNCASILTVDEALRNKRALDISLKIFQPKIVVDLVPEAAGNDLMHTINFYNGTVK